MNVTAPGKSGNAATGTQVERATGGLGKSDFLRLLTQQLRYQDPLNPMEDKDMMAQLAQFSALEETQGMRLSLDKVAAGSQMAQGASFLGRKVTGTLPATYDAQGNEVAGKSVSGIVSGVAFRDGGVLLKVGNDELPLGYANRLETAG